MKHLLTIAFGTALAVCSTLHSAPAYSQDVAVADVLLLAQNDISDQTILTFLRYRPVDFSVDDKDVQQLNEAGVGEDVIAYLREQDVTSIAELRTYVVPTGYNTDYPSYYYGTRLVGSTALPLDWYDHRYVGLGYPTDERYAGSYNQIYNVDHPVSSRLEGHRDPFPASTDLGRHLNEDRSHRLQHSISERSHSLRHGGSGSGLH